MKDKKPDDEVISRDDITYTYSNGEGLSFVIFEVYSAHSNGEGLS